MLNHQERLTSAALDKERERDICENDRLLERNDRLGIICLI